MELLHGFLIALGLTALSLGLAFVLTRLMIRENTSTDVRIERFGAMFQTADL